MKPSEYLEFGFTNTENSIDRFYLDFHGNQFRNTLGNQVNPDSQSAIAWTNYGAICIAYVNNDISKQEKDALHLLLSKALEYNLGAFQKTCSKDEAIELAEKIENELYGMGESLEEIARNFDETIIQCIICKENTPRKFSVNSVGVGEFCFLCWPVKEELMQEEDHLKKWREKNV